MQPCFFEMVRIAGRGPLEQRGDSMAGESKPRASGAWVSASEVAGFAYCSEQWRLEYGLKLEASNQSARRAGRRHHARKAGLEHVAGSALLLAKLLGIVLVLGVLYLLAVSR